MMGGCGSGTLRVGSATGQRATVGAACAISCC